MKTNEQARRRCAVVTTVHSRRDTRIFVKQVCTLRHQMGDDVFLVVADGLGDETTAEGVKVYDLGATDRGRRARAIKGNWRALRLLRRLRPRRVHFHDPELIPLGLVLKTVGVQVIYDVHEDVPRQIARKEWIPAHLRVSVSLATRALEWVAARVFDAVVGATPAIVGRFPERKSVLVQNFPLRTELIAADPIPYAAREPDFCYVGGLAAHRGAREIVLAVGSLPDAFGARLHIAGRFNPPTLLDQVAAFSEWKSVIYHGTLGRDDVANLFGVVRAGIVTFLPAPNHMDAQPTKLFEYMAAGLPVIVSDFPLWREIVDRSRCGLLVDPNSPAAIADAMKWILAHPAEAEAMGKRGQEAVGSRYNWEREGEKLLQLYERLSEAFEEK